MSNVVQFFQANPAVAVAAWLALGTLFQWLASKAEAIPRLHALLSIFGIVTIPVQALAAAAWRLVTGTPPPPTAIVMAKRSTRPKIVVPPLVVLVCGACFAGCLAPRTPAQQESDGASLLSCIGAHWGEPIPAVAVACTSQDVAVAEDGIADVEALFESRVSPTDAGSTTALASFPYATDVSVVQLVHVKLSAIAQARRANVAADAGTP